MLLNKAHSPQYTLWLLPFFVLLQVRWGWFVAYLGFDAALFFGLFSWYQDLTEGQDFGIAKQATVIGVWGRAIMLVLLAIVFLRSRDALPDDRDAATDGPDPSSGAPTSVATQQEIAAAPAAVVPSPQARIGA